MSKAERGWVARGKREHHKMRVQHNRSITDHFSGCHSRPEDVMPFSQLSTMSLEDKWFDWGPGASGWWPSAGPGAVWLQGPSLAVRPDERYGVGTLCGVLVTVDKPRSPRAGSPRECAIWFHARVQLHDNETCMESPILGPRSSSTERRKWGQRSTKQLLASEERRVQKTPLRMQSGLDSQALLYLEGQLFLRYNYCSRSDAAAFIYLALGTKPTIATVQRDVNWGSVIVMLTPIS